MQKIRLLLLTSLLACELIASAQEADASIRGFSFGINCGVYFPSKYTAAYYNGDSLNENSINYILKNYVLYNQIFQLLNAHDTFEIHTFPTNMHYNPAMRVGLFGQYTFDEEWSLSFQANLMKLTARDALVIEVDHKPYLTEQDYRLFPIIGTERRAYLDIGVKRNFQKTENFGWFLTAGLNINSTKRLESKFYIDEQEFTLVNPYGSGNFIPGQSQQFPDPYQGGIGFGVFAEAGATFNFLGRVVIEPFSSFHYLGIHLQRYEQMRPGIGFGVRFIL